MGLKNLKNGIKKGIKKVKSLAPSKNAILELIDVNTVEEIRKGSVFVADSFLNSVIETYIDRLENPPVTELAMHSIEGGRIEFKIVMPKLGNLTLIGGIGKFHVKKGTAVFVYHVEEHKITESKVIAWIFSQVSLGLMYKFMGESNLPESVDVKVGGNTITVDFSRLLASSRLAKDIGKGISALDLLEIESAVPKDRGVELKTCWKAVSTAKEKLASMLGMEREEIDH